MIKRNLKVREVLDPKIWGEPLSPEQIAGAQEWNDNEGRRTLGAVLDTCFSLQHLAEKYSVDWQELTEAVKRKEILGVDLGEAGYYIPLWQFSTEDETELKILPVVDNLWEAWGKDSLEGNLMFCKIMVLTHEDDPTYITPLQAIQSGDSERIDGFRNWLDYRIPIGY